MDIVGVIAYLALAGVVGWVMWREADVDGPYSDTARVVTAVLWGLVWPVTVVYLVANLWFGWVPADGWDPVPVFLSSAIAIALFVALVLQLTVGTGVGTVLVGSIVGLALGGLATAALGRRRRRADRADE